MGRLRQAFVAIAVCVTVGLPVHARAAVDEITTSPTPLVAAMSSNGRFVAWTNQGYPDYSVTVVDRQTMVRTTYDLVALTPPTAPSRVVVLVSAISDDGRYLTYVLPFWSTIEQRASLVRFDRQTSAHLVLFSTPVGQVLGGGGAAVSRDGQTFTWAQEDPASPGGPMRVMVRQASRPTSDTVGVTCLGVGSHNPCQSSPVVSGDGSTVVYVAGDNVPGALAFYDVASGAKSYSPEVRPATVGMNTSPNLRASADASFVLTPVEQPPVAGLFERTTGRVVPVTSGLQFEAPTGVSDDGSIVVVAPASHVYAGTILHRPTGLRASLPVNHRPEDLSADGSLMLVQRLDFSRDAFVLEVQRLDDDGDGMLDVWERTFGLDPTNAADAALDPNGDGLTNLQAFVAGHHPTAPLANRRLFAEGAAGSFFDTVVSVFNPGTTPATIVTRLQGPAGEVANNIQVLAAGGRADIASCCLSVTSPAEFATTIDADAPVVAERRMTWDRVSGYGSHASAAADAPSTTWHFAEGATIAGFHTFLLLQNPGTLPADVDVDYLLPGGAAVRRSYTVPAASRTTVWVNQEGAPLNAAEFALRLAASQPIVAERAMYRDVAGQTFGAGSNAMGVTAPAHTWSFAEGATGDFFDTFLLVANTSSTAGTVTATYTAAGSGGATVVTRSYTLPGDSRLTIWVDHEDPALADAAISTVLTADVPIVAERSMWWPGTAATWAESHVEFGATARGLRWAIADAELDTFTGTDTFVLVDADTGGTPATVRVTAYGSLGGQYERVVDVVAGRNTLWMTQLFPELAHQRFSLVIESVDRPGGAATLTVEKAIYSRAFAAGAAARATMLP